METDFEPKSKCCNGDVLEFHLWPNKKEAWKKDWGEDLGRPFRDVTVCFTCRKECDVEYLGKTEKT